MPRFVVLTHDFPVWHWDLMLEGPSALRTWRLARSPDEAGPVEATPLDDHRFAYLEYEGPVSGNRGVVRRWDRGDYAVIAESATRLEVQLAGGCLEGTAVLEWLAGRAADSGGQNPPLAAEGGWAYYFNTARAGRAP